MEMGKRCDPSNNIWLPFIRNAVGPMDFTPGAMCNVHPEENNFDIWTHKNAGASGTRAYQMALYVVFESGLQMMSDSPTLYTVNALVRISLLIFLWYGMREGAGGQVGRIRCCSPSEWEQMVHRRYYEWRSAHCYGGS